MPSGPGFSTLPLALGIGILGKSFKIALDSQRMTGPGPRVVFVPWSLESFPAWPFGATMANFFTRANGWWGPASQSPTAV